LPITESHSDGGVLPDSMEISDAAAIAYRGRDFWGWFELLWDERRRLIRWGLAGFVLACLLAVLLPRKYEATTRVLPSETTSSAAMMTAGAGAAAPNLGSMADLLGTKTSGALCAAILRSDTVLDAVIDRFDLRKVYHVQDYDTARTELADHTVISEDKKSGIVVLTVTDRQPQRVAAMTNAYAEEADKLLQSLNTSSAHREREFLEPRIAVVRDNLIAAEKQLAQFSSNNSVLDIKEQGKAAFEVTGKTQGELIATQSELQGLRQIYGPDYPRVKSLEAKAAALRKSIAKLGAGSGGGDEGLDYLALARLPGLGATYADIFREVNLQAAVYEALVKQYEISKVEEVKATPRLLVIDHGKVPARKSSPRILLLLLAGMGSGLVGGVVAVRCAEQWTSIQPADRRKLLVQRVLLDIRRKPR
jgi:uncharacterized protein involved in exopolysaccharide biosynthesis